MRHHLIVWAAGFMILYGCGDDDFAEDGREDSGSKSHQEGGAADVVGSDGKAADSGIPSGEAGPQDSGPGPKDSGPGPSDGGSSPADSGPVGVCDDACTGAKMCNDQGECVCAPGWTASASQCVATPLSHPATRTKADVCARFAEASQKPTALWKAGGGDECDPGTVPYEAQVAALNYLNFYRWMVGVGPVQVLPKIAKAEQECAKILGYSFGHSPPPTTKCYTDEGAAACGASLIASGYDLMTQFDGYEMEIDQNLVHRRNILSVGRAGVWTGTSIPGGSAMHYGGSYPALDSDPEYVAHPGSGPNVLSRVPKRWFVQKGTKSIPALDARVVEVGSGTEKPMKRNHHYKDFSSFDLSGWSPVVDTAYRVELIDDDGVVFSTFETVFIQCP
ncbi:MAG TPA: hypothetical protein PLM08_12020 [Polyangiaceae bacterium]|nr:hypothetical protein [Polyangiaceae bacterium]